ncbi:MAG: CotH kinase family protein [Candidatus Kuenenbacteria bacterium]
MFSLPRIYYKIKNHKKISLIIIAVFLIFTVILPLGLYKFSSVYTRAQILQNNRLITKMLPFYWKVRKMSDILYLPNYFRKNNLPVYQLEISKQNIKKLNDSLPQKFSNVYYTNKVYVPAEFRYGDTTYQVQVRHRGDNAIHWNAPKKSYLVKFNKDDLFQGYRQLSFIIPNDRYFALEHFNNYRAGKLGLLYPPSFFANLEINGKKHGLYFVIENWNQEMLVKWQVTDESNFYGNDFPTQSPGIERTDTLWDNLDRWQKYANDARYGYQHYSELFELFHLLNDGSDEEFYQNIFNLIDKENFYNWQILQELSNANHHLSDNIRIFFNNTSGKFYFIPWDVEGGREGPAIDHLGLYGELTGRIFTNPLFAFEKNKLLYDYANNQDNFKDDLAFYDNTYQEIKTALYKDRLKIYTNHYADSIYREFRQKMIDNFARIKNGFDAAIVFVDAHISDDDSLKFNNQNILAYFDINVNSRAPLYLKKLDIKLLNDQVLEDYVLYYDKNNNLKLDKDDSLIKDFSDIALYTARKYNAETNKEDYSFAVNRFYLLSRTIGAQSFSDNLSGFKVTFENAITSQEIKNKEISVKIINDNVFKYFSYISDIKKFISLNPIFKVEMSAKQISLASGSYYINQTIIVPSGYSLNIAPGTTLFFAPRTSLVSYSPITALGTSGSPISFLSANSGDPWGVLAVLNSKPESIFAYCNFSNGSDDYINGVFFSAMLSIYHSPAKIEDSQFSNAQADDGLNIKSTKAEVLSSKFINNSADAIDFDFITSGHIKNNTFINNGNDGIDLSGSTVLIEGNHIENSGDKCISIGEKSLDTIIDNNTLSNCNIGVEIKDESNVVIKNSTIKNNQIGLHAYIKKSVFGPSITQVFDTIFKGNEKDIETKDDCQIIRN